MYSSLNVHAGVSKPECGALRKYRLNEAQSLGLCLVPQEKTQPWTFQQHYTYGLESMVTESVRKTNSVN